MLFFFKEWHFFYFNNQLCVEFGSISVIFNIFLAKNLRFLKCELILKKLYLCIFMR